MPVSKLQTANLDQTSVSSLPYEQKGLASSQGPDQSDYDSPPKGALQSSNPARAARIRKIVKTGIVATPIIASLAGLAVLVGVGLIYLSGHGGIIPNLSRGFHIAKDWVVNQVKNVIHSKPMQDTIHFLEKIGQTALQNVKKAGVATAGFVSKNRVEVGLGALLAGTFVAGCITGVALEKIKPLEKMRSLKANITRCFGKNKLTNEQWMKL